jgi:hypothetical protein
MAPEAAAQRIAVAINLPKKRLFGLLKTQREFVGVVAGVEFEIWERQARAVHAVGRVSGVHGGSRVEARFVMTPRTQLMLVVFFALYAVAAFGIAAQGVHGLSIISLLIAVAGSLVLAGLFSFAARSQRAQLRDFVARVFE